MSYDSTQFPRNEPLVKTACEGIQKLIEQLSLKDNPPINWNHYNAAALSEKKDFSNVILDHMIDQPDTRSDKLGHSSLIALSKWTLQAAGYPMQEEISENTEPMNQMTIAPPNNNRRVWRKASRDHQCTWKHQFGSEYAKYLHEAYHRPSEPARFRLARSRKKRNGNTETCIRTIEDAELAIRTGAVVDICVTIGNASPPTGFFRVSQSASGRPFAHNNMYLNIQKEPNWDRATQRPCITALCLIFPDRKEVIPPGFQLVRHADSTTPADFGMSGERIFWCFRLSREGNPLTDVVPLIPHWGDAVPSGYTVIEKSSRGHTASFSFVVSDVTSAGLSQTNKRDARSNIKVAVFLAYRQRLANLECLRPQPLLMAIQQTKKAKGEADTLESYFGTGGSVVSSSVGRFHILDRSTHELLGAMSVKHRLKLIDASRQKCSESEQDLVGGIYGCASFAPFSRSEDASSVGGSTLPSARSIDGGSVANRTTSTSRTTQNKELLAVGETVDSAKITDFIPFPDVVKGLSEDREQALVRLPIRTALLVPILSACYTRHGGASLLAVEILTKLLTNTSMFDDDVETSDDHDGESCSRLTLLDLCVQALCDIATSGAEETAFSSCVQFAELAIRFSQGQLSTRTLGFVFRLYFFVFSFGKNGFKENQSGWFSQTSKTVPGSKPSKSEDFDVPLLLDCRRSSGRQSSLAGGAPQAAALALKELVYFGVKRISKVSSAQLRVGHELTNKDAIDFVKANTRPRTSIDGEVERATYTELALHQVQRSGGSEMFWHDMFTTCGQNMFGRGIPNGGDKDTFALAFTLFANVIKVSSGKLRPRTKGSLPRDLMCKLISLELLLHFFECWRDEQKAIAEVASNTVSVISSRDVDILTFSVRRMVAACLLWNTEASHESQLVYKRVFRIVSEIWCSPMHRKRCKVEIGILVEHFAVRILEVGPQFLKVNGEQNPGLYFQQTELLKELKKWFAQCPIDVVEFFLNYDTDLSLKRVGSGQHLPDTKLMLLQRISLGLCGIAEISTRFTGQHTQTNRSLKDRISCERVDHNILPESLHATETENKTRESATTLRALSLDTISQIVKSLALSAAFSLEPPFSELLLCWNLADDSSTLCHLTGSVSSESNIDLKEKHITHGRNSCRLNKKGDTSETVGALDEALQLAKDSTIDRAVEHLIVCNVITTTPRDVALFLQSNRQKLDAAALGNYISEEGVGDAANEFKKTVRYLFVRAISFVALNVDQALRQFLTASGFRLPGEAQKTDRLLRTFSKCFYEDNAGDMRCCPFESEDPVFVLCFAIIMLNTDLHKVRRRNQRSTTKMTKIEFVENTRNAHESLKFEDEYLAAIYDSVKSCPIIPGKVLLAEYGEITSVDVWLKYARDADSRLRDLALCDLSYLTLEEFTLDHNGCQKDDLYELSRQCTCEMWKQWHSVIGASIEVAPLDKKCIITSLEILWYAIVAAICVDVPVATAAFLKQLRKFALLDRGENSDSQADIDDDYTKHAWSAKIVGDCALSDKSKLAALKKVFKVLRSLQMSLSNEYNCRASMTSALKQIETESLFLNHPSRAFLRFGDLHKMSSWTGRSSECRLYLFSDVLLYCNAKQNGRYKILGEFPLHLLKIIDWFPPSNHYRHILFEVHHPGKSLQILCSDYNEKNSWVFQIREAVRREVETKSRIEAARL